MENRLPCLLSTLNHVSLMKGNFNGTNDAASFNATEKKDDIALQGLCSVRRRRTALVESYLSKVL